jgi:hypothetical protein
VLIRPDLCVGRVIQDCSRITSTSRIFTRSAPEGGTNAQEPATDNWLERAGRVRLRRSGSIPPAFAGLTEPRRSRKSRDAGSRPFGNDPSRERIRNPAPEAIDPAFRRRRRAMLSLLRLPF